MLIKHKDVKETQSFWKFLSFNVILPSGIRKRDLHLRFLYFFKHFFTELCWIFFFFSWFMWKIHKYCKKLAKILKLVLFFDSFSFYLFHYNVQSTILESLIIKDWALYMSLLREFYFPSKGHIMLFQVLYITPWIHDKSYQFRLGTIQIQKVETLRIAKILIWPIPKKLTKNLHFQDSAHAPSKKWCVKREIRADTDLSATPDASNGTSTKKFNNSKISAFSVFLSVFNTRIRLILRWKHLLVLQKLLSPYFVFNKGNRKWSRKKQHT